MRWLGGEAFAPELLLDLLLYGYATGVFSPRKIDWSLESTLNPLAPSP